MPLRSLAWVTMPFVVLGACAEQGQGSRPGSTLAQDASEGVPPELVAEDAASMAEDPGDDLTPLGTPDAGAQDAALSALPAVNVGIYFTYPGPNFPPENPANTDKRLLGKALFWDEQLSSDDTVACGTCHRPSAGGADPRPSRAGYLGHPGPDGLRGSEDDPRGSPGIRACTEDPDGGVTYTADAVFGADVQVTRRRSMSALDAMFFRELFWDGRAGPVLSVPSDLDGGAPDASVTLIDAGAALESQALGPIMSSAEMACTGRRWSQVVQKLQRVRPLARAPKRTEDLELRLATLASYPAFFQAAFGDPAITPGRIAMAIATYERSLVADQTPWDRYRAGALDALSAAELQGFTVYVRAANCQCCHPPPMFGSGLYVNDGFSRSTWDRGRAEVTRDNIHTAAFRVPILRNVGLRESAGLLHDGVGAGKDLPTLIQRYTEQPLAPGRAGVCIRGALDLTDQQKADLVSFLRTGLTDPRARDELPPFDHPALSVP
jgi:cytochrome c peroxidase